MKRIHYKIVRSCEDKLLSSYYIYPVEYKVGEWTKSVIPNTGLLVFKYKAQALYYMQGACMDNLEIYECECKYPVVLPPTRIPSPQFPDIKEIIQRLWKHRLSLHYSKWPTGTLSFKHVKLLKRIK